jgi:oxygen-independent coproporphyrinogen-3 oxidase
VQHLSAYALSYEEGTLLTRWRDEGRIREASDELSVEMFQRLCQRAREAGFEHYEISNFALPHRRSRHNSSYWTGEPYLGFGPGAHSYDGDRIRRANRPNLDAYIAYWLSPSHQNTTTRPMSHDSVTTEHLTPSDLIDEAIMCGLRTAAGIDLPAFGRRFGQPCLDTLLRAAAPHIVAHRLLLLPENAKPHTHLRIAEPSWMVADDIMSDLMTS